MLRIECLSYRVSSLFISVERQQTSDDLAVTKGPTTGEQRPWLQDIPGILRQSAIFYVGDIAI